MKAIILYDTRSSGGSTDRFVDALGKSLVETGAYVEKGKCRATADYSFLQDFDVVIMGAPVYYLLVSSELLGSFFQSNLKKYLRRKKIALFLTCGSPEPMATMMYLPQLKIHMVRNKILAEKVFAPQELSDIQAIDDFVRNITHSYRSAIRNRNSELVWIEDAQELLAQIPSFLRNRIKIATEEYAEEMGYGEITPTVIDEAKTEFE
ncbi:MAG: protochlorophyllide oxidoreductase [Chlorobium phaeobacteroides]|uniref:Proto-chlorophyllide reductase 57 kD subunit n=1 Tax=Chlorobium phaeobacteroides (strain BS1) TaxID=331678 RepID=B3EPC8_CHLPB|nr:protochlorophyllide oxidoreductase [Chlorobium phaeobacteroides]MBL6956746.1 protochlorophyllide oxidoreductase [Chlorobium phaeobacteroides]